MTAMSKIIRAGYNDLPAILDLQYLAYQTEAARFGRNDIQPLTETLDELKQQYESGIFLKLVKDDGAIIGSVRAHSKDGTAFIGKLMVHPDHRRKGYATMLLSEIEKCFPGCRYELYTSTRSIENIRLYEKLGYRIFDRRQVDDELVFVYLEKI